MILLEEARCGHHLEHDPNFENTGRTSETKTLTFCFMTQVVGTTLALF